MPSLTEIEGIGPSLAAACVKSNYRTIAKVATAKPSDLSRVPGISEKGASLIIASAKKLLPKILIPKNITKNKRGPVAPMKVRTSIVEAQSTKKSKGKKNAKPDRQGTKKSSVKSSVESSTKPSVKEKKMSASESKEKIKKLKKKIKKLKAEKKKIIAKEDKKPKKKKGKKSSKKK